MKLRIYRFTQFKNRRRATHVRALCKFAEAANEEKKKKRKTRGRAMKKKKKRDVRLIVEVKSANRSSRSSA